MSEEKKSFVLCVNEVNMALLNRVLPGISYIEVRGMDLTDNKEFRALVTPVIKEPETAHVIPE